MFCKYCGGQLPDHVKFCKFCGEKVFVIREDASAQDQNEQGKLNWFDFKRLVILAAVLLTAVLAVVALIFGLSDRGKPAPEQTLPEPTQLQTTQQTPTEETTEPEEKGFQLPKPEKLDLEYTLTKEDIDTFYALLEESETAAVSGQDLKAAEELADQLEEQFDLLDGQCSVANVLSYADTKDEALSEQLLSATDMLTQANDAYLKMLRRVYQSDSPIKEELFVDWSQRELDMLLAYTDEIAALSQRNSELLVEYRALDKEALGDDMVSLYVELVANYNKMAQIYGYENFYAYAYEVQYARDYSAEEVHRLRANAKQYLLPMLGTGLDNVIEDVEGLRFGDSMKFQRFLTMDFDESEYVANYLQSLPEDTLESMLEMFEGNGYFTKNENAMAGAFTTSLGDRSFCFFGPGYATPLTVVHELGHYYSSYFQDLSEIPMDLAELHSQGDEWLFIRYLEQEMTPDLYEAVTSYKLFSDVSVVLVCLIVDEFEERVYSVPDVSQYSRQDLEAIMDAVCEDYGGTDYLAESLADLQAYWKMVVMESPVYYISYAVSAVAAMEFYLDQDRTYEQVMDMYITLCQTDGVGFREALETAGLRGPFDEEIFDMLAWQLNIN